MQNPEQYFTFFARKSEPQNRVLGNERMNLNDQSYISI